MNSEQDRAAMIERADAFVASKGNPRVEGDGNLLRFWLADFALEQIEADRRRIVAELTAQIDENKNTIGDWAWGREEGLEIAINIVKGESK